MQEVFVMADYVIATDNTADLPYSYYKEHGIEYTYLTYMMDGQSYGKNHELEFPDFYARMKNGSMPTTSQVNAEEAKEIFCPILEQGKDILYLALDRKSTRLNSSHQIISYAVFCLKK